MVGRLGNGDIDKPTNGLITMPHFTTIQSALTSDAMGEPITKTFSISFGQAATSISITAYASPVWMSLTEAGLDIVQQRYYIPDMAGTASQVIIPAPYGVNHQLWFRSAAELIGEPYATLSVMVS